VKAHQGILDGFKGGGASGYLEGFKGGFTVDSGGVPGSTRWILGGVLGRTRRILGRIVWVSRRRRVYLGGSQGGARIGSGRHAGISDTLRDG